MGTLYVVPTPIGNLEDITLRALRVLKQVALIAAEDTRTTRVLLDHYEITTPMTSYHEHNKLSKLDVVYDALATGDVALVSDAGTPGISDPGYELVQGALERSIPVVPLPGANAVITALVGSGLPTDSFVYLGFLPKKDKAKRDLLASLADEPRTLVAYENPYRVGATLRAIAETMGDERPVCIARELTKMFEEYYRDGAAAAADHYEAEPPKGEVTLVIGGATEADIEWDEARVREALARRLDDGEKLNKAAKAVAKASGWHKRDVYALAHEE
ncbi:MAG: 16S rRNA (cytidine(1402)-2'-O)-methyltransferase [Chloroflexota bacterium]